MLIHLCCVWSFFYLYSYQIPYKQRNMILFYFHQYLCVLILFKTDAVHAQLLCEDHEYGRREPYYSYSQIECFSRRWTNVRYLMTSLHWCFDFFVTFFLIKKRNACVCMWVILVCGQVRLLVWSRWARGG